MLAWAGAPLPLFHPDRGEVRRIVRSSPAARAISMARRARRHSCHHEKLVVVDDETAFVGGIDLTALAGDRLDSNDHPAAKGSAGDTALRLEGPVVADRREGTSTRWHAIGPDRLRRRRPPAKSEVNQDPVHYRTVPAGLYELLREGEWSILELPPRAAGFKRLVPRASFSGRRSRLRARSCAGRRATTSG